MITTKADSSSNKDDDNTDKKEEINQQKPFDINDFISKLESVPLQVNEFYTLFSEEEVVNILRILGITKKYSDPDWVKKIEILSVQEDLVILQCSVIQLLNITARLAAISNLGDDILKTERSKLRVKCKQHKGRSVSKLNLEDVKDISYVRSEDNLSAHVKHVMGAEFCKFLYYSTNNLVSILDKAVGRLFTLEKPIII